MDSTSLCGGNCVLKFKLWTIGFIYINSSVDNSMRLSIVCK